MSAPALVSVRPGVTFNPLAAASFRRHEAKRGRIDVNSSYRDWDTQERWHNESVAYNAGRIPYPGHAYAVAPEYSEHCLGNAYDTDDWDNPGFLAQAAEYGWIQTDKSRGEEHHLAYRVARDKHRNETAPAGSAGTTLDPTTPPKPKGPAMFYIQCNPYPAGQARSETGPFAGATYRRDERTGAWRACTNIETEAIVPDLVSKGLAVVYGFDPADLQLLFAVDGLLEQAQLVNPPQWGPKHTTLAGLGAPTGKRIFPGSPAPLGTWHTV